MERQELYANLSDKEKRQTLEIKLKSEGFLDCLRFFELVEYLDLKRRKSEIEAWERNMVNSYGQEMVDLAIRGIVKQYDTAYQEALMIAAEYKRIGFVERVFGYLGSDYEDFTSWLNKRA